MMLMTAFRLTSMKDYSGVSEHHGMTTGSNTHPLQ